MDPSQSAGRPVLATLKLAALGATAQVVLVFGILAVAGFGFTASEKVWLALPLVVGLADVVLIPAVGSTVRPLPYGASAADLRRISAGVLRTVIVLRVALAEAATLFGLLTAIMAHSLVPYVIGAVFAVPLLLAFAYPSRRVVGAVRLRLESAGVAAGLPSSAVTEDRTGPPPPSRSPGNRTSAP